MKKREKDKWVKVGVIGVDAGICWVGDPCYVLPRKSDGEPGLDYDDMLKRLSDGEEKNGNLPVQFNYAAGHPGMGVCSSTGCGDGMYPVYARLVGTRVEELRVVFDGREY